ncbi:hypothetical protein J1605_015141 [Eschrichtius robustus]|uniref:Proline-rich acidic protein 1 n=1 Tax=Eschrichtius robustus TaxID=9764 RepID=A0AB34GAU2_ESCRO|nr:hypothetical protein J1605_015141 [Eschrichtius robustus]
MSTSKPLRHQGVRVRAARLPVWPVEEQRATAPLRQAPTVRPAQAAGPEATLGPPDPRSNPGLQGGVRGPGSRCGPVEAPSLCLRGLLCDVWDSKPPVDLITTRPLAALAGPSPATPGVMLLLITSLGAAFLLEAGSARSPQVLRTGRARGHWGTLRRRGAAPLRGLMDRSRRPQVLVQTKGKVGAEQGTEEAWGARAVEPPEKDSQLMGLFVAPKLLATTGEKRPGAEALAETKDTLGRVPSPRWGPEPDHDSLYHNWPEEAQGEARPWAQVLPPQQVLQGPEEDRDHIYHPKEDSWEP